MKHIPLYKKVYTRILQEIRDGVYQDGDKLPAESELSEKFSASAITVKHALSLLSEEKLIRRVPGTGSFVTLSDPEEKPSASGVAFNAGVVMSGASDAFGSQFIYAACDEARKYGCGLMLGIGYATQREETEIINHMVRCGARGVIIMPMHAQSYNIELLRHAINGYPLVQADRFLEGLNVPFVGSDNEQAAFEATQYLLSVGHKRVAYLSPMANNTTLSARRQGYIRAYAEYSLSLDSSLILSNIKGTMPEFRGRDNDDITRIQQFVRAQPGLTAIVAADSPVAILAEEALSQMNLKVPEDISIVCFDAYDSPIKASHFTHIRQDEEQMGRLSFVRLYEQITGAPIKSRTLLKTNLVLGRSSRPLPEKEGISHA